MLFRGRNNGEGIHRVVDRLFYTKIGSIAVSALFGLALAMMFQRVCKDKKCVVFEPPPMNEVLNSFYKVGNDCYKYTPVVVKCHQDA